MKLGGSVETRTSHVLQWITGTLSEGTAGSSPQKMPVKVLVPPGHRWGSNLRPQRLTFEAAVLLLWVSR